MSHSGEDAGAEPSLECRRIDQWLWFARVAKSRTLAAGLVELGKVRLNRARVVKSSQSLRVGDVLTVTVGPKVRLLKVMQLGARRGPPAEARTLYEDMSPPAPLTHTPPGSAGDRAPGAGRPTKRERRHIDRFKGG